MTRTQKSPPRQPSDGSLASPFSLRSSSRLTTRSSARPSTASSRAGTPPRSACTGTRPTEAVGRPISIVIPPEKAEDATALLERSRRRRAGRALRDRAAPQERRAPPGVSSRCLRCATTTTASSARRRSSATSRNELEAENRLRVAAEYARSLIEASLDPLVTISPEGKITDLNEATAKATGRSRESLIGTDFSDYFTEPETAARELPAGLRRGIGHRLFAHDPSPERATLEVLYNASVYKDSRRQRARRGRRRPRRHGSAASRERTRRAARDGS